jgi:hypothetical protein
MAKTRTDLIRRSLEVLGVLAAGQSPSAEDVSAISDNLQPVVDELAADEIVYIADLESIDDALFLSLAVCVADAMSDDFGVTLPLGKAADAKAKLLRIGRNTAKYTPQVTSYF